MIDRIRCGIRRKEVGHTICIVPDPFWPGAAVREYRQTPLKQGVFQSLEAKAGAIELAKMRRLKPTRRRSLMALKVR